MPAFEWEGLVRVTIGSLTRAHKLDLWVMYNNDDWLSGDSNSSDPLDNTRFLMKTDAMIAAVSTRRIELCQKGKWVEIESAEHFDYDGERFTLSYPPTAELINHLPAALADRWIEVATDKNGGITANLTFFTSLRPTNGKTNSEPKSDEQP